MAPPQLDIAVVNPVATVVSSSVDPANNPRINARESVTAEVRAIPKSRRLQRSHAPLSYWLQWSAVLLLVPGVYYLLAASYDSVPNAPQRLVMVLALAGVIFIYPRFGIFRRLRSLPMSLLSVSLAWATTFAALVVVSTFIGRSALTVSHVYWWAGGVAVGQVAIVLCSWALFRALRRAHVAQTPALLVGSGQLAANLLRAIRSNPYLPEEFVGVVSDSEHGDLHPLLRREMGDSIAPLGTIADLADILARQPVERIYLALPFVQMGEISRIHAQLEAHNIDIVWVPDMTSIDVLNPTVKEISGIPLLSLSESPMSNVSSAYLKSLFDVVFASLALVLVSPIMIAAALAVRFTSAGPVLYKQTRHGWDGNLFEIWKFRSMYVHNESAGQITQARKDDSRVTPVGRFLRKTSIDELPQLFNVLNGSMSLVGPRPHAVVHNHEYARRINSYMSRHRIKPGITGLAQISGLRGETETLDKMRRRVEADISYINNWSLWADVVILLKTPISLFVRRGAY